MLSQTFFIRAAILRHIRLPPPSVLSSPSSSLFVSAPSPRLFSEAAGTYLDKNEVQDRVLTVVKNFMKVDPKKVTPDAHFQKDLGLDSLDAVEVMMSLEEEFAIEIPDNEADKIFTTADAIKYIASHPQAK